MHELAQYITLDFQPGAVQVYCLNKSFQKIGLIDCLGALKYSKNIEHLHMHVKGSNANRKGGDIDSEMRYLIQYPPSYIRLLRSYTLWFTPLFTN